MSIPLIILGIFSIFFGFVSKDIFIGMGSGFFSDNSIFIHPIHEIMLQTEFNLPFHIKILPIIITILSLVYYNNNETFFKIGINIGLLYFSIFYFHYLLYLYIIYVLIFIFINIISKHFIKENITCIDFILSLIYNMKIKINNFYNQRLFIELFYNKFISGTILNLGGQTTKILDKGSIEYIGPYGLEIGLLSLSNRLSKLDTGQLTTYALYILSGLVIYLYFLNNIDYELLIITFISIIYILYKK